MCVCECEGSSYHECVYVWVCWLVLDRSDECIKLKKANILNGRKNWTDKHGPSPKYFSPLEISSLRNVKIFQKQLFFTFFLFLGNEITNIYCLSWDVSKFKEKSRCHFCIWGRSPAGARAQSRSQSSEPEPELRAGGKRKRTGFATRLFTNLEKQSVLKKAQQWYSRIIHYPISNWPCPAPPWRWDPAACPGTSPGCTWSTESTYVLDHSSLYQCIAYNNWFKVNTTPPPLAHKTV